MNAEKESNPKKAAQRKRQADTVPHALHETEKTYAPKQDQAVKKTESSGVSANALSGNAAIPSVHGPNSAYTSGSEQMHKQLQESAGKTGDLSHPETQEKEKDYRSTLSINELRDYQDTKTVNAIDKVPAEKTVVVPDAKALSDASAPKAINVLEAKDKPGTVDAAQDTAVKAEVQPEAKTPTAQENPGFIALQSQIDTTAKAQQKHDPASKSSKDAQAAAPSPSNERESMAQAGQVSKMSAQEPGEFSAKAFKAELKKKIEGMKLPKNEEEADNFDKNNNIKEVNERAMGDVKQEKNAASGSIANTTKEKPNTAGQPVRNVAKMPLPNHGKAPAVANVAKAMPAKRDAASVEAPIKAQTASIDEQMSANGVTDNMLANSNEPTFKAALGEKNKAKEQSESATSEFRTNETKQIGQTQNEAQAQATKQITGMHGARKAGMDKVHGNQNQTASKDTEKRKEIANKINGIYKGAKTDVDNILSSLDSTVAYKFAVGSKAAKAAFEKHVEDNMEAYKRRRYSETNRKYGALAVAGQWLWDKAAGLPAEVEKYFKSGKDEYIRVMDVHITDIANHVAGQLNAAKRRIATGKKDVQSYVDSLSPSLKKLGAAAITEIQGKFSALEKDVDSKKDALIDVLAKKYSENIASIDERIKELKEQNKGLIGKVMNAMTGIFAFIIEVKNTLMNLLAKVAQVIGAIIMDPIGFFSNMIAGVGQGFSNFTANIWTHLKTGFFTWLTGATKGVSITMPEDIFSLKGIFSITMQVLGLGWDGIRAIGVNVVGEPLMKALEGGVEIVQVIRKDGIAGLWEYLKDQFQDLKETIMDAIMDIIQNQVIQAGIKWILGLLSPVGAFVKAIMAIIDVVKFFIQRAAQIAELISAFMDSVAAIASGKVGAVAKAIENALAKAIPVLIGLLAAILGISGLADKVLAVIRKIRQRITNGITKFWNFVKKQGKGLLNKATNVIGGKKDDGKQNSKKDKYEKNSNKNKPVDKKLKNNYGEIAPERFTMNGKLHTLSFEDGDIYMESTKAKLSTKLDRGITQVSRYPASAAYKGKSELILHQLRRLKGIQAGTEKELDAAEKSNNSEKIKAAQTKMDRLAVIIQQFGDTYGLTDIFENEGGEHKEFEPVDVKLEPIGTHQVSVTYHYAKEAHEYGQQDFTIIIGIEDVANRNVNHVNTGTNLVLKKVGTRGLTVPAGKLGEYNYGLKLNSAHVLGDQFLGSGTTEGLNLILTSDQFNKKTMGDAEKDIQGQILEKMEENKDKFVTFDLTVESKYQVLKGDTLIETLKNVHENMTDADKKQTLEKLQQIKQLPRRCEIVTYEARIFVNGTRIGRPLRSETTQPDKWLNKLFKK